MEAYDVFMLLVLIAATIFGVWKGMAWQVASLASLVVSYFVALKASPQIAPMFGEQAPWNRYLAMLALYLVTSLVIWMAFRVVSGMIDRVKLSEFDRQIGGLFGLAKGVLLCVAITIFAVSLLPEQHKQTILESRSGYYIAVLLDKSHNVIPPELHDVLHPYIHQAQEQLNPNSFHFHGHHNAEEHRRWAEETTNDDWPLTPVPARISDF